MATQPVKTVVRHVKPIVSTTKEEARARVISLYKAWYRQIPHSVLKLAIPMTFSEARALMKNEFMKHKDLKDIRLIDMLVIKGQMELKEVINVWKQKCHVMYMVRDSQYPKQTSFLSKFLSGKD